MHIYVLIYILYVCVYICMYVIFDSIPSLRQNIWNHHDKISEITILEKFCPSLLARWTKHSETTTSQNKPLLFRFFAMYFIAATKTNNHQRCKQMLSLTVLAEKCLTNVVSYFRDWFHSCGIFLRNCVLICVIPHSLMDYTFILQWHVCAAQCPNYFFLCIPF